MRQRTAAPGVSEACCGRVSLTGAGSPVKNREVARAGCVCGCLALPGQLHIWRPLSGALSCISHGFPLCK